MDRDHEELAKAHVLLNSESNFLAAMRREHRPPAFVGLSRHLFHFEADHTVQAIQAAVAR